jgi:hypothetical protein
MVYLLRLRFQAWERNIRLFTLVYLLEDHVRKIRALLRSYAA